MKQLKDLLGKESDRLRTQEPTAFDTFVDEKSGVWGQAYQRFLEDHPDATFNEYLQTLVVTE